MYFDSTKGIFVSRIPCTDSVVNKRQSEQPFECKVLLLFLLGGVEGHLVPPSLFFIKFRSFVCLTLLTLSLVSVDERLSVRGVGGSEEC